MKTSSLLAFAAALAGAVAITGCGHTGLNSPEGWNVARSKHFDVYTATPRYTEPLNALEYVYSALSSSFFKAAGDIGKVDVLFVEEDDFRDFFGHRRDFAAIATVPGGSKIGKNGLLVLFNPREREEQGGLGGNEKPAEALTHIFIDRVYPKAPLWFHEGFSAYARTVLFQEGEGQRIACFGNATAPDSFIPLDRLFAMSWDQYDSGEARSWYKHSARMLFDYALHAEGGKRMPAIEAYAEGAKNGTSSEEIIKAAFPDLPLPQVSNALKDHSLNLKNDNRANPGKRNMCSLGFPISQDRAPDIADDRTVEPVPAADMQALIGGLSKLPLRSDGYPAYYPRDVVARSEGGGK